jgi:hypothetical protein
MTVNLAEVFEEEAGEPILFAVVGQHYNAPNKHLPDQTPETRVVRPWAEARQMIDYFYDNGFGGADCHPVTAWSENWVLWVSEYDGATSVGERPRNPAAHQPEFF